MSSGVKNQAFANTGFGQTLANRYAGNAANVYGGLEPQLAAEAAHPSGYSPTQKAAINTAGQQSAGGSAAGAIGAGKLYSARTRNAGGARAAIGEGVRGAGQNLSNTAVGTEVENANLQQKQRQQALGGLESLNATETGAGDTALGLSNDALKLAENAPNSFWQNMAYAAGTPIAKGIGSFIGSGGSSYG